MIWMYKIYDCKEHALRWDRLSNKEVIGGDWKKLRDTKWLESLNRFKRAFRKCF